MFAVLKTGGKQYCVKPGDVFKVEKLDFEPNNKISLSDVLLTSSDKGEVTVGAPTIEGASVNVEILKHIRNKKVIVFKKIRRHNHRRKNGHRQWMTVLKVLDISLVGSKIKGE
ncbi:MAG: 50S ribosomal protein L21 [Holosporales bacterium]|jgi:large subunit ribosomal protein L21|nr:50S ribosomal protein L21 [Holosporales bacterium]